MESITRREFLKKTIGGVSGIALAGSLSSSIGLNQQLSPDMSKVVIARHSEATDRNRAISIANVQTMMDESMKQLTGLPSVADAWASLLPDFREDHTVAIKVNCVTRLLPTHPEVVDAIVTGLEAAGVPANNVIIYDIANDFLTNAGYSYNTGESGVRCFGTLRDIQGKKTAMELDASTSVAEEGWGNDWNNPMDILGNKMALSTIVTRCDHLINVPVLKAHPYAGVTLSLKNHYGSISDPAVLHENLPTACAILNSHESIKDKTRLIVVDGLLGCWKDCLSPPDFVRNSIVVSSDPVAADYVGTEIINEEREKRRQPPRYVPLLEKAAEMGLGTDNPEQIDLVKIDL